MPNIVSIVDSDGNTYTLAVPNPDGQAFYALDRQGNVIVVACYSKEAQRPQFTLAPAEPTADEIALREALEELEEYYNEDHRDADEN